MKTMTEQEFYQKCLDIDESDSDVVGYKWKLLIAFVAGNVTGAIGSIFLLGCL